MSEIEVGTPKDDLDKVCKKYKICQKCVHKKHGDNCIGEAVSFTIWPNKKSRNPSISDSVKGNFKKKLSYLKLSPVLQFFIRLILKILWIIFEIYLI